MTQTINLGTTCPKAGFGEAPQQAFLRPSRAAKIASVATLALLAVSVYSGNEAKTVVVFSNILQFLGVFNAWITTLITQKSFCPASVSNVNVLSAMPFENIPV